MATVTPTITGIFTESLSIFSVDESDEAKTNQEYVDGIASGMLYGAVIAKVRDHMVAKSALSAAGYKQFKDAQIGGYL
jgi:hypothetical protein